MSPIATPEALPTLLMKEQRGRIYVFSASPRRAPWNWLSLCSIVGLVSISVAALSAPHEAVNLGIAVCGLASLAFGSIYVLARRSHRTALVDFDAGTIQITEILGAQPETKWVGNLDEISAFEPDPSTGVVFLKWEDPEATPEALGFTQPDDYGAFLTSLDAVNLTSS